MRRLALIVLAMLAFSHTAYAAERMTATQVKELFSGKTFDGVFLPKNKKFKVYEDPDGTHNVLRPNGKRDKGRTWKVNGKGQHCSTHPKTGKWRCSFVADVGNGVFHKFGNNDKHTHTLKNFRDGNHL